MKIALRTPDIIRRMTDRFDLIAPTWSHTKRLTALAAMFGYHGWEDLVASCDSTAPLFIFDQDLLSDEARQQRWLAMAEQLAAALDLLLPTALIVVQRTLPTSQIGREYAAWYEPNRIFDQAFASTQDVWWVCFSESGHPFVPPGLVLAKAVQLSDLCKNRSSDGLLVSNAKTKSRWVLVPSESRTVINHPHIYFKSDELVEVMPLPLGDSLREPRKHAKYLDEFLDMQYPHLTLQERTELIAYWRTALKALHDAAGLPPNTKRRWIQMTLACRTVLGRPWFWPIKLKDVDPNLLGQVHKVAIRTDALLREHFGRDPGFIRVV